MSSSNHNKTRKPTKHSSTSGHRFVPVPAEAIVALLEPKGFTHGRVGNEKVMINTVKPGVQVRVYTSASVGAEEVRECGEDAIRIQVVLNGGMKRGGKDVRTNPEGWALNTEGKIAYHQWVDMKLQGKRINRAGTVEGVLVRIVDRVNDAVEGVNGKYGDVRCPHCNGATYRSRECISRECRNRVSQQTQGVNRAANGREFNDNTLADRHAQGLPTSTATDPATDKQKKLIVELCKELKRSLPVNFAEMAKGQAMLVIKQLFADKGKTTTSEDKTGK